MDSSGRSQFLFASLFSFLALVVKKIVCCKENGVLVLKYVKLMVEEVD